MGNSDRLTYEQRGSRRVGPRPRNTARQWDRSSHGKSPNVLRGPPPKVEILAEYLC